MASFFIGDIAGSLFGGVPVHGTRLLEQSSTFAVAKKAKGRRMSEWNEGGKRVLGIMAAI